MKMTRTMTCTLRRGPGVMLSVRSRLERRRLLVGGVGQGWCVGGVQAGDETVDLIAFSRDLAELPREGLHLRPEAAHLLDGDAGVHQQAAQLIGGVGRARFC